MYGRQILKKLNGLAIHKKRFNCSEIVFNLYVVSITFLLFPRLLKWQVFLALPTHITISTHTNYVFPTTNHVFHAYCEVSGPPVQHKKSFYCTLQVHIACTSLPKVYSMPPLSLHSKSSYISQNLCHNRPSPCCPTPLFQSEAKCETIDTKIIF